MVDGGRRSVYGMRKRVFLIEARFRVVDAAQCKHNVGVSASSAVLLSFPGAVGAG